MIKKGISILLALCLVLALLPVSALAAETSGTCGYNAQWSFDASTGTLTITGTGDMKNYSGNTRPWESFRSQVQRAIVENGITRIGVAAFSGCDALQSVSIPHSVTSIGTWAFQDTGLTSLTVPGSITKLNSEVFSSCPNLTTVVIEEGVTALPESAFEKCPKLSKVTLPESLTVIGKKAFQGCTGLTKIKLPNRLQTLSVDAFNGSGLTEISIPASVTLLAGSAFAHTRLKNVTVPNVKNLGGTLFSDCENLETAVLEDGIISIPEWMFNYCTNLKSVKIPNSITSIGSRAFYNCSSLTEIAIPQSVTDMGGSAFSGCDALKNVYYAGSEAEWGNIKIGTSNECLTNATIHFGSSGGDEPVPPAPSGDAKIVSLDPESGSTFQGTMFDITFDREIAERASNQNSPEVDLTIAAPFQVHRASDDSVVYTPGEFSWTQYTYGPSRSVLRISPNYSTANGGRLAPGEQYYITMGAGFVKFADGSLSPEIKKGEWEFSTEEASVPSGFATWASITMNTNVDNRYATNVVQWEDAWFEQTAEKYNHKIAIAAAALSGAAYVSSDKSAGSPDSAGIFDALRKLDFNERTISSYNYTAGYYASLKNMSDINKAGYTFACKEIRTGQKPEYLVAVVVKGTSPNEEWYSNFNLFDPHAAPSADHWGFAYAASSLYADLQTYLSQNKLTAQNTRFLVTGHSRGAAVANIISHQLSAFAGNKNVFGYTYACPNVSRNITDGEKINPNIFNIVNPEDFVSKVPTNQWGYGRWGRERALPSVSNVKSDYDTLAKEHDACFKDMTGQEYESYHGTATVNSVTAWASEMLSDGTKPDVTQYDTKKFVSDISKPLESLKTLHEFFNTAAAASISTLNVGDLLAGYKGQFAPLSNFFIERFLSKQLGHAHSMANYFSWMGCYSAEELWGKECGDGNSTSEGKTCEIACPVNVYVYDPQNKLVASVVNNGEEDIATENGLDIYTYDGAKYVTLPNYGGYRIEIEPYDDGTMTCTITEYSMDGDDMSRDRTVTLSNVAVKKGEKLTATVPAGAKAPRESYDLLRADGTVVHVTSDTYEGGGDDVSFTDVQPGAYFYDAVAWAVKQGVTNGIGGGKFGPNNTCNRGQIVTFLWRAAGSPEPASTVNPFTDVKEGDYFYKAVLWAVENDITTGAGPGKFNPTGACTRAQAVTFLWRANNKPQAGSSSAFGDVAKGSYYENAVAWAVANGITNGAGAGRFSPEGKCTRGQIVTFLYRSQTK